MNIITKLNKIVKTTQPKQISRVLSSTSNKELMDSVREKTKFLDKNCTHSERIYCVINNITTKLKCPICNRPVKFKGLSKGYSKYCSNICSNKSDEKQKLTRETCIKKYGVDNIFKDTEYIKQQTKKKLGVDNIFKDTEYIKQQTKKKLGVDNIFKDTEYIKQRFKEKHGVENSMQVDEFKLKQRKSMKENHGVEYPFQIKHIRKLLSNTALSNMKNKITEFTKITPCFDVDNYSGSYNDYLWNCSTCNTKFYSNLCNGQRPICPVCFPIKTSKFQTEIIEYIHSLNITPMINDRKTISPLELDCIIKDKKIAFEFNGNYWHSESNGKDRKYHINKTELCEAQGIRLIQIFEDEWYYKKPIIKSKIKHLLGKTKYKIYGRSCYIREISSKQKNKFLNKYHIQGSDKSKIHLGAFYKNRLVSVMTFSNKRIALGNSPVKDEYELSRFCSVKNFNCVGVANKLLKHFERTYNPKYIITYADKRWSNGNLYPILGFKFMHISKPNYWYTKNYLNRVHRYNFRKNILRDKLEKFDPNLSEWKNMQNNGWDRIWDCGNLVFTKSY